MPFIILNEAICYLLNENRIVDTISYMFVVLVALAFATKEHIQNIPRLLELIVSPLIIDISLY